MTEKYLFLLSWFWLRTIDAVFWIWYKKNVDNILMILVVAKKSRTFSSFSDSANEQVCRTWEGA